jgi:hypothetical protein
MRAVRNLLNELVERRLWPVALLLVAALVAVPVLLAKSPSSATDETAPSAAPAAVAAAAAAAAAPPGGAPVVSVAQADEPNAPLRGHAKNPFRQQHTAPKPATGSATATSASTPSSGTSGPAPSGGAGGSGSGGGTQPQPQPKPTFSYASVDVRFGHAGQQLRTIRDVPRLTPLPNATHPIVVFLGMRRDRTTAVFLVSTDVHVQGLGHCVPSRKDCEAIELHEGDTVLLDFAEPSGRVEQYELDLDSVTLHTTTSQAVAQRAYARASRVGKLLVGGPVHSSVDGASRLQRLPFRYVQRKGVLHIAPWASQRARTARAHRAISGGRLADLTP